MKDLCHKDKHGKPVPIGSERLIKKNFDVAFMTLVPLDFTSLKLYYVQKGVSSLQIKDSVTISTLEIIDHFDIHKSLNYVIVITKDGMVHVFSLKTNEYVFKYALEMRIKDICIDTSGLYMVAGGVSPKLSKQLFSLNCS
jgi:hypothetical protein